MQGSNGLYRTTHIRKVFAESIVLDYIDLIEIRCGDFKETNSPIIGYSSLVSWTNVFSRAMYTSTWNIESRKHTVWKAIGDESSLNSKIFISSYVSSQYATPLLVNNIDSIGIE